MLALRDHPPLAQHDDVIRPANLRQAVRDQQRRSPFRRRPDRLLDFVLGGAVDGAGAVVQDQDRRVGDEGARQRQTLTLPAAQRDAALPDDRLVAFGEAQDELVRLRLLRRLLDFFLRRFRFAEANIVGNRPAEQENILLDDADLRAQLSPDSSRARPRRRPARALRSRRRCG